MKRRYLIQGDLDGACFLYSIANAVVALSGRKPTITQWSNSLQYIPFAADFLKGNTGTKNYDEKPELYEFAIKQALSELSPNRKYKITSFLNIDSIADIDKLINQNSVIILNINSEHWICIVSVLPSQNKLLAACSDVTNRIYDYSEEKTEEERYFNREYIIDHENRIHKPSVIQISIHK